MTKFMTNGEVHSEWCDDNLELGWSWSANVMRVLQDLTILLKEPYTYTNSSLTITLPQWNVIYTANTINQSPPKLPHSSYSCLHNSRWSSNFSFLGPVTQLC